MFAAAARSRRGAPKNSLHNGNALSFILFSVRANSAIEDGANRAIEAALCAFTLVARRDVSGKELLARRLQRSGSFWRPDRLYKTPQ